jgi:Methyltransferase domain
VGTWKGGSAINMANYVRERKLKCRIFCIDTWLGSLEHWKKKDSKKLYSWYSSLRIKNGYPTIYYQFLYNVISHGLQSVIIPFPNTSLNAARWFLWKGIRADLVYLDASHEEWDVYQDLSLYYTVVKEGGIIFGDDWSWEGVKLAVSRFAQENKLIITFMEGAGDTWIIRKLPVSMEGSERSNEAFRLTP